VTSGRRHVPDPNSDGCRSIQRRAEGVQYSGGLSTQAKGGWLRLPHGWRVSCPGGSGPYIVRDFLRPAVRAVPSAIASRLPRCEILLAPQIDACSAASRWTINECSLKVTLATQGVEPHDLALELLVCVGQVLWDALRDAEQRAWLGVLATEIDDDVTGEIDEDVLPKNGN